MNKSCRLTVWVFWISGDQRRATAWLEEQQIARIPFGVVPADQPELKSWNIPPGATNTLVLVQRAGRKTLKTFVDVMCDDVDELSNKLPELLRARARR